MPSVGRPATSNLWLVAARGDGKLLLLPAERLARRGGFHFQEHRKTVRICAGHSDSPDTTSPLSMFSRTVMAEKIMRPCGT